MFDCLNLTDLFYCLKQFTYKVYSYVKNTNTTFKHAHLRAIFFFQSIIILFFELVLNSYLYIYIIYIFFIL